MIKIITALLSIAMMIIFSACVSNETKVPTQEKKSILHTYADIAYENYSDTLFDAKALHSAVNTFVKNPTKTSLADAKTAWLKARESYGESEIFRLANGPIDAKNGWVKDAYGGFDEQLNAWPLDENMIDYTINAKGERTSGNIIDSNGSFNPGGEDAKAVDITTITVEAITALNENGGTANVATGYHAVEFLLWGQDQDYSNFMKDSITHGAMTAGQRDLSDYTSDKNAPRRKAYLHVATQKIVNDLEIINSAWSKTLSDNCQVDAKGCYRAALLGELQGADAHKNISAKNAKRAIFTGMGVFIKSEVANERIAVAVLTPSEEDEQSCFSDNTHRDIAANYQGFKNILMGTYKGVSYGSAPIDALTPKAKAKLMTLLSKIEEKIEKIDKVARTSRHFDYQIHPNDPQVRVIVKLKNELRKLGDKMVSIASANGINLSTEDVTNSDETKL